MTERSTVSGRSGRGVSLAAASMLSLMAVLMFASAWEDSPTTDDVVSIASGYSYLRKQEYRLEPQNPPLIKDLAAVPLVFMKLREPWDQKGWDAESDPDVQGRAFLYNLGNDAMSISRAAKAPNIFLTVAFGWFLFWWTRKEFGGPVALLSLFLFTFSPTLLAHGRIVTTDVGAAAGFFVATTSFVRFLKNPTRGNMALAGLAMGFAFLTKFSTIALIPITLFLAVAWVLLRESRAGLMRGLLRYLGWTVCIIAIAYVAIYPVYLFHVWNYVPARQVAEAKLHRDLYGMHGTAKDMVIWASDKSVLRPWAEYFLGMLVALRASHWGQPLFFLGKVYPTGLRQYFPVVYLIKEPLAMHLLTLVALLFALGKALRWARRRETPSPTLFERGRPWLAEHFTGFAFVVVLGVYWAALIRSNMNIGVRHLLAAFPLTFILVANQIVDLWRRIETRKVAAPVAKWFFRFALGALLAWQAITVVRVHPSYLAYFNEIAGGPEGGWRYVNDSNLDWGQDLKRLATFVEERNIPVIHGDFFGPGDPSYFMKEKYQGPVGCGEPPKGWVAVSAMTYPGAPWNPQCDYRRWLPIEKLVAKVGYSIFIFHVD